MTCCALTRRLLVEGGVGQFANALVAAAPARHGEGRPERRAGVPGRRAAAPALPPGARQQRHLPLAANVRRTARACSLPARTSPGTARCVSTDAPDHSRPARRDGGLLPGLPVVNIGFSRHLAWTHGGYLQPLHPVSPGAGPEGPAALPGRRSFAAAGGEVRRDRGTRRRTASCRVETRSESIYGPLVVWPGGLGSNRSEAYALRDANLENTRVLQQWYSITRLATSPICVGASRRRGIPWVNTLAADEQGNALYMNQSVVPTLKPELIPACAIPQLVAGGCRLQGQDSRVPRVATGRGPGWYNPGGATAGAVAQGLRAELQRQRLADQPGEPAAGLFAPGRPGSSIGPRRATP
ncbi:penicillin acylase family protein [Pseudomonas aeruginosa]